MKRACQLAPDNIDWKIQLAYYEASGEDEKTIEDETKELEAEEIQVDIERRQEEKIADVGNLAKRLFRQIYIDIDGYRNKGLEHLVNSQVLRYRDGISSDEMAKAIKTIISGPQAAWLISRHLCQVVDPSLLARLPRIFAGGMTGCCIYQLWGKSCHVDGENSFARAGSFGRDAVKGYSKMSFSGVNRYRLMTWLKPLEYGFWSASSVHHRSASRPSHLRPNAGSIPSNLCRWPHWPLLYQILAKTRSVDGKTATRKVRSTDQIPSTAILAVPISKANLSGPVPSEHISTV